MDIVDALKELAGYGMEQVNDLVKFVELAVELDTEHVWTPKYALSIVKKAAEFVCKHGTPTEESVKQALGL
jgi:hypothetical protein